MLFLDIGTPLDIHALALFGAILLGGVIGGQLAHLTRFLPRITGYIIIGYLLGPHASGILNESLLERARVFTDLATGLVLFQLGLQVNIEKLWKHKILLKTGIYEGVLTFVLIFSTLLFFQGDPLYAAIAAAIGVSSSPAVTLLISREFEINGPVTRSSLNLTAINNLLAFCFFTLTLPFLHIAVNKGAGEGYLHDALLNPSYRLIGSLILAFCMSRMMIWLGRFVGKNENIQFALIAGALGLTIGLAKIIHISALFTMLVLGSLLTTFDRKNELMEIEFGHIGEIFFVILFVIAGAHLNLQLLTVVGGIAALFVIVRLIAKMVPVFFLSRRDGFTKKQSCALGLTLLPMASMAIGLVNTTENIAGDYANSLYAMIFAAIAILETIGPIMTVFALKMAGEIDPKTRVKH